MSTQNFKRKIGAPPGDLIYTGDMKGNDPELHLISYNLKEFLSISTKITEELPKLTKPNFVNWVNVAGLRNIEIIKSLGDIYSLHSLLLEDILHIEELPKAEEFDNCIFLTFKMLKVNKEKEKGYEVEHISLVLGSNYVLSFQEDNTDLFNSIRARIFENTGKVRRKTADYLFHLLIDAVVDNYYYINEHIDEKITSLELELINKPSKNLIQEIVSIKKEVIYLKRIFQPLRDAVRNLAKEDNQVFINKTNKVYFNNIGDHLNSVINTIDSSRETLTGLMELHMTNISIKMNEVMKTLTVITTIFIPLTFIAGIYGMNFQHMPELEKEWAYPAIWGVMGLVTIGMLLFMKKKGFFGE